MVTKVLPKKNFSTEYIIRDHYEADIEKVITSEINSLAIDSFSKEKGEYLTKHGIQFAREENCLITILNRSLSYRIEYSRIKEEPAKLVFTIRHPDNITLEEADIFHTIIKKLCVSISDSNNKICLNYIRDDLALFFAERAYPYINDIENDMRSLVAELFTKIFGNHWQKPINFVTSKDKAKDRRNFNTSILHHKFDFIDLYKILTRDFPLKKITSLEEFNDITDTNKENYIPVSIINRYLAKNISNEWKDDFKQDWQDLYSLRNDIAHCKRVSNSDFARIKVLTEKWKNQISELKNNIKDISLPEEHKKIAEEHILLFLDQKDLDQIEKNLIVGHTDKEIYNKNLKTIGEYYFSSGNYSEAEFYIRKLSNQESDFQTKFFLAEILRKKTPSQKKMITPMKKY